MCKHLVFDTNISHIVLENKPGRQRDVELRNWIAKENITLCYTNFGGLGKETRKTKSFHLYLETYRESGKALIFGESQIVEAKRNLCCESLKSNDIEMLALCIASSADIIATKDEDLKSDILNLQGRPQQSSLKIYPEDSNPVIRNQFLSENRCI